MIDSFDPIAARAKDLGFRMAQCGFEVEDNPYSGTYPRLSRAWNEGLKAWGLIKAWERKEEKDARVLKLVP